MSYLLQRYMKRGQNENRACDVMWFGFIYYTATPKLDMVIYILIRKLNKWCFLRSSMILVYLLNFVSVRCACVRFERERTHFSILYTFYYPRLSISVTPSRIRNQDHFLHLFSFALIAFLLCFYLPYFFFKKSVESAVALGYLLLMLTLLLLF